MHALTYTHTTIMLAIAKPEGVSRHTNVAAAENTTTVFNPRVASTHNSVTDGMFANESAGTVSMFMKERSLQQPTVP